MKTSILEQSGISNAAVEMVGRLVEKIPWPERRLAMGDVAETLLKGKKRLAEEIFGWKRSTVELGMNELRTGIVCVNDLSKRRKRKTEEKYPEMLLELHTIMAPVSQAESHLKTDLAYTKMTATAVRSALLERGLPDDAVPTLRILSNILNRQKYRLRRVVKSQVQKKTSIPIRSSRT